MFRMKSYDLSYDLDIYIEEIVQCEIPIILEFSENFVILFIFW